MTAVLFSRVRLRRWAEGLRRDIVVVWLAARDPRVPRHAKAMAVIVAGYALSPIDLIPDFIPVLGYLDDLLLVPLGLMLVLRLIPPAILADLRRVAEARRNRPPKSRTAAAVIVALWAVLAAAMIGAAVRWVDV